VKSIILTILLFLAVPAVAQANIFDREKAESAYQNGQYDEALRLYQELLKNSPQDPQLNFNLGDIDYRLKKYDEAEKAFKQSLNSESSDRRKEALYNIGNTMFRKEKLEDALAYYEKALQIDPKYQKAQLNRDYVKKLLEQKKNEQQKQQDQKQQQQQKQDEQQKQSGGEGKDDQKNDQNQQGQGQQDQKQQQDGQGEKQDQKDSGQQDQKKDQGENGKPEEKDQQSGQGKDQQNQDSQKSEDQKDKQEAGQSAQDGQSTDASGEAKEGKGQFTGKYDEKADQWLESVNDDPGQALKKIIDKKSQGKPQRLEKDW
jgi:Ca-activated chloride channel family protein